jgi:hypothetical protein
MLKEHKVFVILINVVNKEEKRNREEELTYLI